MTIGSLRDTVIRVSFLVIAIVAAIAQGCGDSDSVQDDRRLAESALDGLAADLVKDPPVDAAAYTKRLTSYLDANPSFYGSAAALVDNEGKIMASPYVYRTDDGYASKDLASPSYDVESQGWFTEPIAANEGVWTEPYFDAGGGEIWMITRSVTVRDSQRVLAVVTTDLAVDAPNP